MTELLVFARAPRLHEVKTRLAAEIGAAEALRVYRSLLRALAVILANYPKAIVCYTPGDSSAELRPCFPPHWEFRPQTAGTLGDRLESAVRASFDNGASKCIVIGSDCPYLTLRDIHAAERSLDSADLVLGPARDGGYWLIGLRSFQPALFQNISWGTATVLSDTLAAAARHRLSSVMLRELEDVDSRAELDRWQPGMPPGQA